MWSSIFIASNILKEKRKRRKRWGNNIAEEKAEEINLAMRKTLQFSNEIFFILKLALKEWCSSFTSVGVHFFHYHIICLSNQAMQTCYMRFNDLFKRTLSFEDFLQWVIQKTWGFDRSLEQKACFFSVIASPFALICVWKDAAHPAPLCPHSCLFLDHLQFQFQASVAAISGKHCLPVYCWLTADKKREKKKNQTNEN